MGRAFEWRKAKKLFNLDGDDWPERLTARQISTLHFPDDRESAKVLAEWLEEKLDTKITDGMIGMGGLSIDSEGLGMLDCGMAFKEGRRILASTDEWTEALKSFVPNRRHDERINKTLAAASGDDWIAALSPLAIKTECEVLINGTPVNVELLERFDNGWPKRWAYLGIVYGDMYCYIATPLISRLNYAAWRDRPELPVNSPLSFWLAEAKRAGVSNRTPNKKRTATYTKWYATLCANYNDNSELIRRKLNQLTNDAEILECWNLAAKDEKYLWAQADSLNKLSSPTKAAQEWFCRNAHLIRGFKKEPGK